jgi:hypothetical protein
MVGVPDRVAGCAGSPTSRQLVQVKQSERVELNELQALLLAGNV